jgi:signal transduction histidine kinase/ligand-binding sensor domain-containing protein
MFRRKAVGDGFDRALRRPAWGRGFGLALAWMAGLLSVSPWCSRGVILWSDLGTTKVHETGAGSDILGGAVKRDNTSSDTLYFKFHVDPHSDWSTEPYFAAFQLYEGEAERLGIGNSFKAWAYSAFNTNQETSPSNTASSDFVDLLSAHPEPSGADSYFRYELPRRGTEVTIVFKVQYVPGGDDLVTAWMGPDLGPGATEASQPTNNTTAFIANASFDQIRLRHGGGGEGWSFSDMAIATSFSDFVGGGSGGSGVGGEEAVWGSLPFTFRFWLREQGLPQNSVRALAQTRDGYLWIGSDDGIARFDGVRFLSYGSREGLRNARVRVLFEDSGGVLWIGTAGGGLASRRNGRFETLTIKDGLPADSITALAEDASGRLWVGTESGLAVLENGHPMLLDGVAELKGRPVTTLYRDRHKTMWVGATGAGVFQFVGGKLKRLADPSVEALLQDPHCLLEDRGGRLWIGAGDYEVLCLEKKEWRQYKMPRHLARPYVSALVEQPDGTVWAGSVSEGLVDFRGGKLEVVNASSGLSDNFVESMLVDSEGNLWVGTGAGLNRIRRSNLSVYGQGNGLDYGPVQGLAETAPGLIWAAQSGAGLFCWQGRGFSGLAPAGSSRGYQDVNALMASRDGSCWAAGQGGVWHLTNSNGIAQEVDPVLLTGLNVSSLAEDHQGGTWAGTHEGEVWRRHDRTWTVQTNLSQSHAITAILIDAEGAVWIGSEGGGLLRFKDGKGTHFGAGQGLLSDLIRCLYLDAQGTVWIGTAGGGLSRWRDGATASFTTREGLPDNTISQILEDDSGRLWLGSNRGIACVRKPELEELAAGKLTTVYPQVYGRAEGMASEECTGGFFPAGLKTKSGMLWFSTLKGIVVADPHPQGAEAPAPVVLLEEVLVDGLPEQGKSLAAGSAPATQNGPEAAELRIAPGRHSLEFRYTGLNFTAPDRVRFRYRLEKWDPDWVEAKTSRTASYGYVPPGDYRFRVIACNSDGRWSEEGASLGVVVLPHFWQAPWFLTLGAFGLLALVGGAGRLVGKRKHQRRLQHLEEERALERERARIAQDLHDDLGSSLTRISLLSDLTRADKDNPALVETHANKISQSAGQTVRALEEIVWALRPGSDSLQSLVEYIAHFANEMFEGDIARCRLDLPPDLPSRPLPPEMRHNIFLVVKEALTNALKHASAKEVRVQAKASDSWLEIIVQDDGKGFETQSGPTKSKRNGLGNMRRRAEAMGGSLLVESHSGKGTIVRLRVTFPAGAT